MRREITLARRIEPPDRWRNHVSERQPPAPPPPASRRQPPPRPTKGPAGEVRWWERPAPGGHEALWAAVRRLQAHRLDRHVSVSELARWLAGIGHPISRETLSRVLNGKQPTSWETVQALADVLGVDPL